MKTLVAAATLLLSASSAMAAAPCENPVAHACEKACAAMGAKYVLAMRQQGHPAGLLVRSVRADNPEESAGSLENAQRLAGIAGLSLDYIDGLTLPQSRAAIAAYCPR